MKNKKYIWKIVSGIGILAVGGFGYLYFSGSGNGALADGSAAVVQAWNTMVAGAPSQQDTEEIALGSSTDTDTDTNLDQAASPDFSSGDGDAAGSDISDAPQDVPAQSPTDENTVNIPQVPADSSSSDQTPVEPPQIPETPQQTCSLSNIGTPSHEIILNEIAWMGSVPQDGETGSAASNREWIELKNISSGTIDLSGWQILDSAGGLKINLNGSSSASLKIPAGGFYLLVRGDASLPGVKTDAGYSGGLSNTGDELAVFDPNCEVSDLLDASAGWPGGNNATKQTLERDADGASWHTSAAPGGTPRTENSLPIPVAQYSISVSSFGGGIGVVSSSPAGILCGAACTETFASGTEVTVVEAPASDSLFKGWSGACTGTGTQCSFVVSSSASLAAEFDLIAPSSSVPQAQISEEAPSSFPQGSSTTDQSVSAPDHLVIAAIQIAGAASSNDFIKIYNPTAAAIDISGWKLHKKSSTGTDSSLKTFVAGSIIAHDGYFTWANSEGGFADSIGADASTTETLSADNSVALFDANGNIVDQVAWGTGTNQYIEGTAYPTDLTAGQVLAREFANGVVIDTNNNASDFTIGS